MNEGAPWLLRLRGEIRKALVDELHVEARLLGAVVARVLAGELDEGLPRLGGLVPLEVGATEEQQRLWLAARGWFGFLTTPSSRPSSIRTPRSQPNWNLLRESSIDHDALVCM